MSIAGILCLGTGYFFAVTVDSPYKVLEIFLFTVLLVVAGTYLLFMTGSIASLKWMKKENPFIINLEILFPYPVWFTDEENAAGLATICILSTGVIVTLSSCLSLFMGEEDQLRPVSPDRFIPVLSLTTRKIQAGLWKQVLKPVLKSTRLKSATL